MRISLRRSTDPREFHPAELENESHRPMLGLRHLDYCFEVSGRVAKLADAQASGACIRKDVGVQVPPRPRL